MRQAFQSSDQAESPDRGCTAGFLHRLAPRRAALAPLSNTRESWPPNRGWTDEVLHFLAPRQAALALLRLLHRRQDFYGRINEPFLTDLRGLIHAHGLSDLNMSSESIETGHDQIALIERLQRREPTALAIVYALYGRKVYSLIMSMVQNAGIAEDLAQETFLRVWVKIGGFDVKRGALGPWVLTVARNRAVDHLRSLRGRWNCSSQSLQDMEDPRLFADLERCNRISENNLGDALDKLSANQRTVINLAYFEGRSQNEIATRLGYPLGTVKTWVRSALKNLREDLLRESNQAPAVRTNPRLETMRVKQFLKLPGMRT
jgi:RNA polymerase sigma-70 factor (ECF subfamily)